MIPTTPILATGTRPTGGLYRRQVTVGAAPRNDERGKTPFLRQRARNGLRFLVFCALLARASHSAASEAEPARTVPTFHCMSLYWPRPDGAFANRCDVHYRRSGAVEWREGHELWWDQIHKFYAGAVVNLEAGTDYEFQLRLANGATTLLTGKTWPNEFPVARVVKLPPGTLTQTLVITNGGSPAGYVVYEADAAGTTLDADPGGGDEADALDHCVVLDADFVIVRGLTLRNAKVHGVLIKNRHDLVIEGCDISNWGRRDPRAGQRGRVNRYAGGGSGQATPGHQTGH